MEYKQLVWGGHGFGSDYFFKVDTDSPRAGTIGYVNSGTPLKKGGLKQGCTLSPRLFSLHINDIEAYIKEKNAPSVKLLTAKIILLLFADDIYATDE